jgi:hypothetical protein
LVALFRIQEKIFLRLRERRLFRRQSGSEKVAGKVEALI